MKKSLVNKMRQLSVRGYSFMRVSDYYQPEVLLPDEIDPKLDTIKNTPAYRPMGTQISMHRMFLLIISPQNDVAATVLLNGRHGEAMLERCCNKLIKKIAPANSLGLCYYLVL